MKKQSLIKGTIILGMAGVIAKFLGLFFRWPLIMLIGDEGIGYYQMSYPLYTFFIAVASGMPVAISKMVSEKNAVNDKQGVTQILKQAIVLLTILGGGFTVILLMFSKKFIVFLRWDPKSYYSLIGIAMAPIFISIMSAFRGFFQGLQNMNPTAVSQIIEQIGRVVVGIGLAVFLLPRGIEYSAGGAAFGAAAGGIFGGIYLLLKYSKVRKEFECRTSYNRSAIMEKLLMIAIPISLGATVGTIMSLIDSLVVPQKLMQAGYSFKESAILYGQLTGKAFVLVNVPLTLSTALCASLVPIIAEKYVLRNYKDVTSGVQTAIKLSMVIGIPCFLGLFCLAPNILSLLFPGHADGGNILKYLSLIIPLITLSQTCIAILQGIGKYYTPVINLCASCIVKIIITCSLVCIPEINIYGAVIGTFLAYLLACILNVRSLKKTLKISINWYENMVKPAIASIIMIIVVEFIYNGVYNYTISNGIACLSAILAAIIVYLILIVVLKIFKYDYIKNTVLRR